MLECLKSYKSYQQAFFQIVFTVLDMHNMQDASLSITLLCGVKMAKRVLAILSLHGWLVILVLSGAGLN